MPAGMDFSLSGLRRQPGSNGHLGSKPFAIIDDELHSTGNELYSPFLDLVQICLQNGATGVGNPPGFFAPVGDWDPHSRASRKRGTRAFHQAY